MAVGYTVQRCTVGAGQWSVLSASVHHQPTDRPNVNRQKCHPADWARRALLRAGAKTDSFQSGRLGFLVKEDLPGPFYRNLASKHFIILGFSKSVTDIT
jgi:hypothetical protein